MDTNSVQIELKKDTSEFNSVVGIIFSCLGCVIGTGNLWRFPRIVARNSGEDGAASFYLLWFISLFTWSIPLLVVEYAVGRYTKVSVVRSFVQFFGKIGVTLGSWVTYVNFFIGSYYLVILSWCLYYVIMPMMIELPTTEEESKKIFDDFTQSQWPLIPFAISILLIFCSLVGGIKGIEKVNLVLVPILVIILLSLFFYSATLQYSELGLDFLFTADWKTMTSPGIYLDAISQNAFDTAAASGLITTYAIYLGKNNSIMRYALFIPLINNVVSLVASMTIFPTVFGVLLQKYPTVTKTEIVSVIKGGGIAGTGLTFIWMPILMSTMGVWGRVMCSIFFICLSFAGFSSAMSMVELLCLSIKEFGIERKFALLIISIAIFLVGTTSVLNLNFLVNQDYVWGYSLIFAGFIYMALVMSYGPRKFRNEIVNGRKFKRDFNLPFFWIILITVVTPIEALTLIIWWVYSEISEHPHSWYKPAWTSIITTWIEWAIFAAILMTLNVILVKLRLRWVVEKSPIVSPSWVNQNPVSFTNDGLQCEYDEDGTLTRRNKPSFSDSVMMTDFNDQRESTFCNRESTGF